MTAGGRGIPGRRRALGRRALPATFLAAVLAVLAARAVAQDVGTFESVRDRLQEAYNARDIGAVQALYDDPMARAVPEGDTRAWMDRFQATYGRWLDEGDLRLDGRTAAFLAHFERGRLRVLLTLDERGEIAGLLFLPPEEERAALERNRTLISAPFRGRWYVFWGGDTFEMNHHHEVASQRYAFDLIVVDDAGGSSTGDGLDNEDYYAFGREVLAAAAGVVVEAIDGVRDNRPRSTNPYSALGNSVTLRHGESEYSLVAHLRCGSVRVHAGDAVRRGDVLALVGNSGNTSEPHLHFQLQDHDVIQDAIGIKVFFDRLIVTRDGTAEVLEDYSPVRGDFIEPVPAASHPPPPRRLPGELR